MPMSFTRYAPGCERTSKPIFTPSKYTVSMGLPTASYFAAERRYQYKRFSTPLSVSPPRDIYIACPIYKRYGCGVSTMRR